jgi:DNA ligase-4
MIVFFDILLLDDNVCLKKPHRERRLLLKDVVQVITGRADISEQRVLDFCRAGSQSQLESIFAKGVAERWEGFVLKGCEDPYFTIFPSQRTSSKGHWIKLKKDYIPGLGDTIDLAVIGGRYDSRDAVGLKQVNKLLWTHFFIGCLVNKEAVSQSKSRPKFRVIDVIDRHSMSAKNMQILNQYGEYSARGVDSYHGFDIEYASANLPSIDVVFKTPFVVEMLGSGFEKLSGARYYTLRFPRILKIHWDRSFEDAASFSELQLLAEDARSVPTEELTQEKDEWNKRLKVGNGSSEYIVTRSQSLPSTTDSSSKSSQSPVRGHILKGSGSNEIAVDVSSVRKYTSGPTKRNIEKAHATTRPIPIYVDEMTASMSSSDDSDIHGKFLSNNENLSSHQRKNEGLAAERSQKHKDSNPIIGSENSNTSTHSEISVTLAPSSSTQDIQASERHARPSTELSVTHNHPIESPKTIKSLLPTLSIHLIHSPSTSQENETPNIDTFLQDLILEPGNPQQTAKPTTIALILIDPNQAPFGPTLLSLTSDISKMLQIQSRSQPHRFPLTGKVFLLDSTFLNLSADTRSCSRETWEDIGRKYFYACVSWNLEVETGRVDEIPCTPMEGVSRKDSGKAVLMGQSLGTRVSVDFNRRELGVLGLD